MENEKDKKLVITPLDESTKKISQVLANDTCRKILDTLSDEPLSSSQISEKLTLPLTTIDYNIKKLSEVGLITVHHKRWSPKGKKVNYYAPAEKFILIAPKAQPAQIFKTLKSLIPVLAALALISGALEFLFSGFRKASLAGERLFATQVATEAPGTAGGAPAVAAGNFTGNFTTLPSGLTKAAPAIQPPIAETGAKELFLLQHPGIIIFIIGITVILLYVIYKYKYGK